jgi:formylglycine-generating enzyme required for sulfatase activity
VIRVSLEPAANSDSRMRRRVFHRRYNEIPRFHLNSQRLSKTPQAACDCPHENNFSILISMVDQRLEELKRRLAADPKNSQLQCELLNARARVEGSAVFRELLDDRLTWNECPEAVQDLAIGQVKQRLSPDYEWQETQLYSCGGQSHRIASFEHTKTGILLNLIPGGSYTMGEANSECDDECPAHRVMIKPLLLGRFPVRQSCRDKIGGHDDRSFNGANSTMEGVSWEDCQDWLKKAGDGLRLASESEWEYACRSGTSTQYFWGDEMDDSYCCYDDNCLGAGHEQTREVGFHFDQQKWNAFGLVDMSGHVWEWCQDQWIDNYNTGPYDSLPRTSDSSNRVLRGGSWGNVADDCRSAIRGHIAPSDRSNFIGFRVFRSIDVLTASSQE